MKRDYKLFIEDIRNSIKDIEDYMKDISEEQFKSDKKLQDAVIRRLEIMGEATRNIPRALKEKNKHVPWFDIAQFRDFITHSYYELSINRVWNVFKDEIPKIKEALKNISLV